MKIHRLLYYGLLLLLPTQLGYHFWPSFSLVHGIRIDYLAPTIYLTDIIVIGILITWFLSEISNKLQIPNYKYLIEHWNLFGIWNLIFGYLIVNSIAAAIPALALIRLLTVLELVLLVFYIVKTKPSLHSTVSCLLIALICSSVLAWVQFVKQASVGGAVWWLGERTFTKTTPGIATAYIRDSLILRPYATFPHPNVLGGFIVIVLPLVLFAEYIRKNKLFFPVVAFCFMTLLITFSRSAWITGGIIAVIAVLNKKVSIQKIRNRAGGKWLYGFMAILLVVIAPLLYNRFWQLTSVDTQSITLRSELNTAAIAMIRNHPFTGVGLNNFLVNLPVYHPIRSYQDIQPAHTIYLLATAELGIVGIGIFLFVLLKKIKQSFVSGQWSLVASLSTIFFLGFFDHYPYTIHQINLLTAILLGFLFSSQKQPDTLIQ